MLNKTQPREIEERFVHKQGTNQMREKKKRKQEIPKEFHIKIKEKIEQENKGKVLDTFRESQDKYGSHLVEPLG